MRVLLVTKKRINNARVEEHQLSEAQLLTPTTSKNLRLHLINRIRAMHLEATMLKPNNIKSTNLSMNAPKRHLRMLEQDLVKCSTETHTPETAMKKVMDHRKDSLQVGSIVLLWVSRNHLSQRLKLLHKLTLTRTEKVTPVGIILLHLSMRIL